MSRMLAPLGAAAAVLAVAVGVTAVARLDRSPAPGASRAGALRAVPGYYIALTATARAGGAHRDAAAIYATATGALVAPIEVPRPYQTFTGVSAAADDHTFALAAEATAAGGRAKTAFFLARLTPAQNSVRLTAVLAGLVPGGASFDGFALSPDGTRLAVAFQPGRSAAGVTEEVRVLDLGTGAVRTWTSTRGTVTGAGLEPRALTWAGDRTLAFDWYGFRPGARGSGILSSTGVRLLDVTGPGTNLLSDSRLAVRLYRVGHRTAPAGLVPQAVTLSAGGRFVVAAVTTPRRNAAGFAEFSAATGLLVRRLGWRSEPPASATGPAHPVVLWASRSGGTLIVAGPPGHPRRIGIVRGTRITLLPSARRISLPLAAW